MCRLAAAGLLALSGLVGAATPARWASLTEIGFQHLTQDQGLPNAIATALAEDGDGFLWVATLGGLARWDGYHFRVYKAAPGTAGALPDNYIEALLGDRAGRLWVGTSGGGLARYDRLTDRFVTYPVGPKGLSHVTVYSIAEDGAGGLWLGTGGGLDHLDPATGTVRRVAPEQFNRAHLVVQDRLGRLWVGTPRGLFMRAVDGVRFDPVPLPTTSGRQPDPQTLLLDSAGRVWVGTARDGAFMLPADGGPARAVVETAPVPGMPPLQLQSVGTSAEALGGEIWLGTTGHGIVIVDAAGGQTRRLQHRPALPLSLADNVVRRLYRDRSGLIWVAGDRGASRHDPRQQAVLSAFSGGGGGAGLAGEISWILPTPDGRIWLGTHKNGIQIVDPALGLVAELRPDPTRPDSALPPDQVLALEYAGDGQVYIGTKRGLYRASADGRRLQRLALAGRDPAAATWALLADGPLLWVGGQSDGLWRLHLPSGTLTPMARGASVLSDHRITVLARGTGGSIWAGTRFGLNRFDPASGEVQHIVPDPAQEDALPASFVTAVLTDREQRVWVGTYGGGVSLLQPGGDSKRPRFRQITTVQGLPDDNINALLEDADGVVWASTDGGLARIDPRNLSTRALRRAEGAVFPTYWTGSAGRTVEGELLFGGAGGFSIVRPQRVQPWGWRPATVVTELQVGGKPVPVAAHLAAGAAPVTVDPAANSLSAEFTALDYSAPERNRYSYRLLGYDKAWIETDAKHRVASYTNLPPGRYTLQLRGSNRDGQWSEHQLNLPVQVQPAWHQTLAFRVLAVLLALAGLWVVERQRTRFLRRQQAELERKVSERTAELERLSNALQEKSRVLELSAISDPLTGLRNRRFLTQHIDGVVGASLRRAQQARNDTAARPPAVDSDNVFLLIDVDHFKAVNDQHGHAAGDAVLVQFSLRLQQVMRDSDYLVRWGGEEFLAVARDTDRSRAEDLAERIRAVVADTPFELESGVALTITCSIGFACLPFAPASPRALGWQDVVKLADIALFAAKRAGRNAWVGLHATPSTDTAQLLARMQAAPQQVVRDGELRVVSDRTAAAVVEALQVH